MNEPSIADNDNDRLIAELLIGYDAAADKSAFRAGQFALHPELCDELRSLFDLHDGGCAAPSTPSGETRRLAPGDRVGPFRIERFLDTGGMGEVYEARHDRLDRSVALKVIRSGRTAATARERFLREQQVLARLHHSRIVAIYESAVEGELEYFAMPLIDGVPLHSVVRTAYVRQTTAGARTTPNLAELVDSIVDGSVAPAARVPSTPGFREAPDVAPRISDCLTLSPAYFRSAAEVIAQAAEAVQYAHDAGVYHRDIKPSNLMIDRGGHCWIIDFGLAGYLNFANAAGERPNSTHDSRVTHGPMGTPAYMAPEQHDGDPDGRSDVWSLGATLYELLTLRTAFCPSKDVPLVECIRTREPTPPREMVANLPVDLAAICRKALRKSPDDRYQTPGELADDLRRWLNCIPVAARPSRTLRRVGLWARRNKGWATAIACALVAGVGVVATLLRVADARADAATAWGETQTARAVAADQRARASERQVQLQRLQQLLLTDRKHGWSDEAWDNARRLAADGADLDLRNFAAATLAGLDSHVEKHVDEGMGASSIAFDADGRRLLIGGVTELPNHQRPAEGAKVWDRRLEKLVNTSTQKRDGPVAFRADGTPLQLVPNKSDRHTIVLWNVAADKPVHKFRLPDAGPAEPTTAYNLPILMLSADGATVGGAFPRGDGPAALGVWDAGDATLIYRTADNITALAMTPGLALLATGHADGRIVIRSLPQGEVVTTLQADRADITCLTFHRDPRRATPRSAPGGWLLAAGDSAASITIWDCETKAPRSVCRGSNYHVSALTFSPDGATLAGASQGPIAIWDVATGRRLLDLKQGNRITGVAYSPDGECVATSEVAAFKQSGNVRIWRLQPHRGLQILRGLNAPIDNVAFSPDQHMLAGLSHDFRIALWDLKSGTLRHIFEAPKAAWIDNCSIALSADNRLVFAGSTETQGQAVAWELATGRQVGSWTYPPGLNVNLGFHPTGKLLLVQTETHDPKRIADALTDLQANPLVVRGRDLLADPAKRHFEITEFPRSIRRRVASEDGGVFALLGRAGPADDSPLRTTAYDGVTGKEIWSLPLEQSIIHHFSLTMDRAGRWLTISRQHTQSASPYRLSTGQALAPRPLPHPGGFWSPEMPYCATDHVPRRCSFVRNGDRVIDRFLELGDQSAGRPGAFDAVGLRFAWGNSDGSVSVADLPAIQKRLAAIGLGW